MTAQRRWWACAALLVVVTVPLGCTPPAADNPSGGHGPTVVLTIGTDDTGTGLAVGQIREFSRQVARLSGGSIRIEPRYRRAAEHPPGWDQVVDRSVVRGELDMALSPARSWDTEGVRTLRALNTPLLIGTDAMMDRVVSDQALAGDLMAGLEDAGVTGLGLVPEGIRYLVALEDDGHLIGTLSRGGGVNSPRSRTVWAFLTALGAVPDDGNTDARIVAAETELLLVDDFAGSRRALIGNLPLFPKVNVLVVNSERFDRLSVAQQAVLRKAAAGTRDWAVDHFRSDEEQMRSFCDADGRVVQAGSHDVARVRRAADTVTAQLRADPTTAALVDRVARLVATSPRGKPLPACTSYAGDVTDANIAPGGGGLPDGWYRFRVGGQTRTLQLADGSWTAISRGGADEQSVYEVHGRTLYWRSSTGVVRCRWVVDARGALHFTALDGRLPALFTVPWRRLTSAQQPITADTLVADGADLPDGVYRVRFTDRYLESVGLSTGDIRENHGVWTVRLDDGHYTVDQVAPDITDHDEGRYQVRGHRLWWLLDDARIWHARWSVAGDGTLSFERSKAPDESDDFLFGIPWQRVS